MLARMALNMNSIVRPHLVLTWGGTLGTPQQDEWSNTLRLVAPDDPHPSPEALTAAAEALQPLLTAWFQSDGSKIGRAATVNFIKLNPVDEYNHQFPGATIRHDFTAAVEGLVTNPLVPWHQTYALTLRTKVGRGRASKGRIFPPVVAIQPELGSPYCAAAASSAAATAFAVFLDAAQAAIATAINGVDAELYDFHFCIISVGDRSKGQIGLDGIISSVEMDRVADVQHRRTNAVARSIGAKVLVDV